MLPPSAPGNTSHSHPVTVLCSPDLSPGATLSPPLLLAGHISPPSGGHRGGHGTAAPPIPGEGSSAPSLEPRWPTGSLCRPPPPLPDSCPLSCVALAPPGSRHLWPRATSLSTLARGGVQGCPRPSRWAPWPVSHRSPCTSEVMPVRQPGDSRLPGRAQGQRVQARATVRGPGQSPRVAVSQWDRLWAVGLDFRVFKSSNLL